MLTSFSPPIENSLRAHIELWLQQLSAGNWAEVIDMLDEPNSYGVKWGEAEIRSSLDEYSRSKPWAVTDPKSLDVSGHTGFGEFNDSSGFWFDYDIPLDGVWSDLTAQFEFKKRGDGYALVLHDIHVL